MFTKYELCMLDVVILGNSTFEAMGDRGVKVSVIIPCYNAQETIEKMIDSVCSQSLREIEIICIDDGSTDSTIDLIKDKQATDNRIQLIEQANKGPGLARNTGIDVSVGKYIAFMDSDDFYPSNDILLSLYLIAESTNSTICGGSFSHYKDGKIIKEFSGKFAGYVFDDYKFKKFSEYQFDYGFHRFLYLRRMIILNNIYFPTYRRFQDPPFMFEAMVEADSFYSVPMITYCYSKNKKILWSSEKVLDLLSGIQYVMVKSCNLGLYDLFTLNVNRINDDYLRVLLDYLADGDLAVRNKLDSIQVLVNKVIS